MPYLYHSINDIARELDDSDVAELLRIRGREGVDKLPTGEAREALLRASDEMVKLGLLGIAARLDDIRIEVFS